VLADGDYFMPHVVALYRYPVKGFTPESVKLSLSLMKGELSATGFSVSALPIQASWMMPGAQSTSSLRW